MKKILCLTLCLSVALVACTQATPIEVSADNELEPTEVVLEPTPTTEIIESVEAEETPTPRKKPTLDTEMAEAGMKNSKSFKGPNASPPERKANYWTLSDIYNTNVKIFFSQNTGEITTFILSREALAHEISCTKGVVFAMFFETTSSRPYVLPYAPSINNFVTCAPSDKEVCALPATTIYFTVGIGGDLNIPDWAKDPDWCIRRLGGESEEYTYPNYETYSWGTLENGETRCPYIVSAELVSDNTPETET